MTHRVKLVTFVSLAGVVLPAVSALGQGALLRKPAQELFEYFAEKSGQLGTRELSEFGGREAVELVLEKAAREGGEELTVRVVQLGKLHGVQALRVVARSPRAIVAGLDELPEDMLKPALRALDRDPERLTTLVSQYGGRVLRAEVKHPGIGSEFAEELGDDGLKLVAKIDKTDDAIVIARHLDEIDALPTDTRASVLDALTNRTARCVDFLEQHPRTLLSAAGAPALVAFAWRTTEPTTTKSYRLDGTLESETSSSFLTPIVEAVTSPIGYGVISILGVVALAVAARLFIWIWSVLNRTRRSHPPAGAE